MQWIPLPKNFTDLSIKKSTANNLLKTKCNPLFKRSSTQSATRNSEAKIKDRMKWNAS
ncbi:hypothetical protein AB4K20DRAFT_1901831, partial [Rhizopus microsporus]